METQIKFCFCFTKVNIKLFFSAGSTIDVISRVFINGKAVFSSGPKNLPRNPSDCSILDSWVYDNFILADEF